MALCGVVTVGEMEPVEAEGSPVIGVLTRCLCGRNDYDARVGRRGWCADCAARVDAQVGRCLGPVLAQRRGVEVAFGYLSALSRVKANCWSVAEDRARAAPGCQALAEGPSGTEGPSSGELPDWRRRGSVDPGDLIGPGIAVDETAQLKHGDATVI